MRVMMSDNEDLAAWLNAELQRRGWSIRELARRAGISHVAISNVLNQSRNAGATVCLAIARALGVSPDSVFRRAGLLPPAPRETARLKDALWLLRQLPPEDQERIVWMMRGLAELRGIDVTEVDELLTGGIPPPDEEETE